MAKTDNEIIQFYVDKINSELNIGLKVSEKFPGIYEIIDLKKQYFNVETEKSFFEDDLYDKLLPLVDKQIISGVEPNGVKTLAIFI